MRQQSRGILYRKLASVGGGGGGGWGVGVG